MPFEYPRQKQPQLHSWRFFISLVAMLATVGLMIFLIATRGSQVEAAEEPVESTLPQPPTPTTERLELPQSSEPDIFLVYASNQLDEESFAMVRAAMPKPEDYRAGRAAYLVEAAVLADDSQLCILGGYGQNGVNCFDRDYLAGIGRYDNMTGYDGRFDDQPGNIHLALDGAKRQCDRDSAGCRVAIVSPHSCWAAVDCRGMINNHLDSLSEGNYDWQALVFDDDFGFGIPRSDDRKKVAAWEFVLAATSGDEQKLSGVWFVDLAAALEAVLSR